MCRRIVVKRYLSLRLLHMLTIIRKFFYLLLQFANFVTYITKRDSKIVSKYEYIKFVNNRNGNAVASDA